MNKSQTENNFHNMFMTTYLQHLINNQIKVKGVLVNNGWLELDTVDDLKIYEKLAKSGDMKSICNIL